MTVTRRTALSFVIVVGALAALTAVVDPFALSSFSRILSLGLLACSVAILTGRLGLPTLGQVAPYAVGAYTTAHMAGAGITLGPIQAIMAAAAAAAVSLLIGLVVTRVRGITFLMVTLAVAELTAVIAVGWKTFTGGSDGLAGIPPTVALMGTAPLIDDRAIYLYVLTVASVTVAVAWAVLRSPAGLLLQGCRDHEDRMRSSGHPVAGYLLAAYVATGAIAGIGGALLVTSQRYVSPQDVSFEIAAIVLLAVTIGGAGSLAGSIAAVALVVAVRDWVAAAVPGRGPLLLGALFIVAVYLLPNGLAGLRPVHRLQTMRNRPRAAVGKEAS